MTDQSTPNPGPRPPLFNLRASFIVAIGVLIATGVGLLCALEGLGWVEITVVTGGAFAGAVTFLHEMIE